MHSEYKKDHTYLRGFTTIVLLSLNSLKGFRDKNRCDCLQYISDLAEKGICCRKNPEAANVGLL